MTISAILLIASVGALCVGPFLFGLAKNREWASFLDGFALIAVVGLASIHLLPEAFAHGGVAAVLVSVVGFVFPTMVERLASNGARLTAVVFLVGLVPHVFLESAALGGGADAHLIGLGIAIVAHRLPFSLLVFSMFHERYGNRIGWVAIIVLAMATIVGFFVGGHLVKTMPGDVFVFLNAFVGGALLHIVSSHIFHDEESHDCAMHDETKSSGFEKSVWSGAGGVLGVLTLAIAFDGHDSHGHSHSHGEHIDFFETAWNVGTVAAPGLLSAMLASLTVYWIATRTGLSVIANALHVSVGISRRLAESPKVDGPLRFVVQATSLESIALTLAFLPLALTGAWIATLAVVAVVCLFLGQLFITERSERRFDPVDPEPSRWLEQVIPWLVAGLFVTIWGDCLLEHRPLGDNLFAVATIIVFATIVRAPAFFFAAVAMMGVHRGMPAHFVIVVLLIGPLLNPETLQRFRRKFGLRYAIGAFVTVIVLAVLWAVFGAEFSGGATTFDVHHARVSSPVETIAIGALGLIGVIQLFHDGPRLWLTSIQQSISSRAVSPD